MSLDSINSDNTSKAESLINKQFEMNVDHQIGDEQKKDEEQRKANMLASIGGKA